MTRFFTYLLIGLYLGLTAQVLVVKVGHMLVHEVSDSLRSMSHHHHGHDHGDHHHHDYVEFVLSLDDTQDSPADPENSIPTCKADHHWATSGIRVPVWRPDGLPLFLWDSRLADPVSPSIPTPPPESRDC